MDAMFGTINVKYHLFTLMAFDFHHTRMPVARVIMNLQTIEDLVDWLGALWAKLFSHMLDWRPSFGFIVDDAP
jgi:hypothetical protein